MTIDEAISHALEVAEHNDNLIRWGCINESVTHNCRECAADHRQLAEWLTELKELKRNPFATIKTACASVMWCIDCKYSGVCPMQDRDCEKPCEWKDMKEGE